MLELTKTNPKGQYQYIYDEAGAEEVSEQIMNSYNSGVIDQLEVNNQNNIKSRDK